MWKPTLQTQPSRGGRVAIVATLFVAMIVLIVIAAPYAYTRAYQGQVLPGVHLGQLDVGGLDQKSLQNILHGFADALSIKGIPLYVVTGTGSAKTIYLNTLIGTSEPDQSHELVDLGIDETVRRLFAAGRGARSGARLPGGGALRGLGALIFGVTVPPVWTVDRPRLSEAIVLNLQELTQPGNNARVVVASDGTFSAQKEQPGTSFNYDEIVRRIEEQLANFTLAPIDARLETFVPAVKESDVVAKLDIAARVVATGTIAFTFDDPEAKEIKKWELAPQEFARFLAVVRNEAGAVVLGIDTQAARPFFEGIASEVNVLSQDAKFEITVSVPGTSGTPRVKQFQPSRTGRKLNVDVMLIKLEEIVRAHEQGMVTPVSISLVVETAEPQVKTGEANNLGIQELLGVGISNFKGSPVNRKKNIKNGVEKLNGTIIAPGEEFSLLAHLRPFSKEGGYLPELVIKGDKIEPEVGGGLCQIGTTMFRATMKAGMPVSARRNHSIVVRYYNDPQNGSPGTDATIYDPSPDFKFVNDTGNYMLLTTEMDMEKSELYFKLWGTNDGRRGDYTAPVVQKWIGVGADKIIETETLKPGEKKCQEAHPGAVTSFTYFVLKPDGSKAETVYDSYYRPLPKICLVGKAPEAPSGEESVEEEIKGATAPDPAAGEASVSAITTVDVVTDVVPQ